MPPAGAIIGAVLTAAITGGTGIAFLGLAAGWTAAGVGFAASLALSFISSALAPKPKAPDFGSFAQAASGRTQTIRQAISPHELVFGEVKKGGTLVFYEATESNRYHHLVVVYAAHEIAGFRAHWLDDVPVYPSQIDGSGNVVSGKFANLVRIKKHLGADSQQADSDLVSETAATEEYRGRRRAYAYYRIDWDRDKFPNGLPALAATLRGFKCEDPRVSGAAAWSPNAAVCARHWMLHAKDAGGLGVAAARLDDAYAVAAANASDEIVDCLRVSATAGTVDAAADTIALADETCPFQTGDRVELATTGTAPGGLIAGGSPTTDYYVDVIQERAGDDETVEIKLATSYDNAIAGVHVDITSAGSGTLTVVKTGEPRYTCNGVVDTSRKRADILRDFGSALGRIPVYAGGQWRVSAAAWTAPAVTLTEDHLRGPITSTTRVSRRERFNAVKGIYVSPLNHGQPSDYPAATSAAYQAADNAERIFFDHDLPFTSRAQTAQRLAWIVLKRHRNELSVVLRCTLHAYQVQAGDTIAVTNSVRSWSAKSFEVEESTLVEDRDAKGAPLYGVDLKLKAAAATDYDFDPASQEQTVAAAPIPANAAFDPVNPTGLALASGTAQLDVREDGTVFSRLKASWTAPVDRFVVQGGRIEVEYKKSSASTWIAWGTIEDPANIAEAWILDVADGVAYDVRVRSVNQLGVRAAAWVTATGHTVVGKTAVPANVASLTVQQSGNVSTFSWPAIADADRAGYELRYMAAPFVWEAARLVSRETKGTLITNTALPPGTWVVGIKAVDTSGNYSATAATATIVVVTVNVAVAALTESPRWPGHPVGLIRHDTSGTLIPRSNTLASAMTDAQLYDTFVHDPVAAPYYESGEIDLTFDADGVRVYGTVAVTLGPGESGTPSGELQIDYRDNAASYDGFEPWPSAANADFRYLKGRVVLDTSDGVEHLDAFTLTTDKEIRTEQAAGVTIAGGGTAIAFAGRFHAVPAIQVTPQGAGSLTATVQSPTVTGFTAHLFNAAGTDAGGTADWTARGA